jgi:hypothetical protein
MFSRMSDERCGESAEPRITARLACSPPQPSSEASQNSSTPPTITPNWMPIPSVIASTSHHRLVVGVSLHHFDAVVHGLRDGGLSVSSANRTCSARIAAAIAIKQTSMSAPAQLSTPVGGVRSGHTGAVVRVRRQATSVDSQ